MQEWFQNLFAATLGLGDLGITVGLVVSVIVKIVIILTSADSDRCLPDVFRA